MHWVNNDGGRARAGFKGINDDCVARAIAIANNMPYEQVIHMIDVAALAERPADVTKRSNSQTGVYQRTHEAVLVALGWVRIAKKNTCMTAGSLPGGTIIVDLDEQFNQPPHFATVIDGVVHDTFDPSCGGKRRMLAYYQRKADVGRCKGCGHVFKGDRGLSIHQSKKFVSLACRKGV